MIQGHVVVRGVDEISDDIGNPLAVLVHVVAVFESSTEARVVKRGSDGGVANVAVSEPLGVNHRKVTLTDRIRSQGDVVWLKIETKKKRHALTSIPFVRLRGA